MRMPDLTLTRPAKDLPKNMIRTISDDCLERA